MSELKTKPNKASVAGFISSIDDPVKKQDSKQLLKIMGEITGEKPVMWGTSIIGFGSYHYKYASGREGDWFCAGFSPRKQSLTLYIMGCHQKEDEHLYQKLGKHKTGKSCLYIKKLSEIELSALEQIIRNSVNRLK